MFYNPYIVIPFATWLITQTLKFAVAAVRGELNFKYLYASGGMPSVHSAVVCSLAVTSLLVDGSSSHLFGFTLLFAAIVMYDSFGVRRSTGEQAVALNMIVQSLGSDRIKLAHPEIRLREVLGHQPVEVGVGAALGVALAALFNISHLAKQINYIIALPVRAEFIAYTALFGVVLVGGWAAALYLGGRYRDSKVMARLSRAILSITQTIGWLGLLVSFTQYQHLPYLSYRVWSWLLIIILVVWKTWLVTSYWSAVPIELAQEREAKRKTKWFSRKKKR